MEKATTVFLLSIAAILALPAAMAVDENSTNSSTPHIFKYQLPETAQKLILMQVGAEDLRTISDPNLFEVVDYGLTTLEDGKAIDTLNKEERKSLFYESIVPWLSNWRRTAGNKMAYTGQTVTDRSKVGAKEYTWFELVRMAYLANPGKPFDTSSLTNGIIPSVYAAQPRAVALLSPTNAQATAQYNQGIPL
jgi:hypothetical protein